MKNLIYEKYNQYMKNVIKVLIKEKCDINTKI